MRRMLCGCSCSQNRQKMQSVRHWCAVPAPAGAFKGPSWLGTKQYLCWSIIAKVLLSKLLAVAGCLGSRLSKKSFKQRKVRLCVNLLLPCRMLTSCTEPVKRRKKNGRGYRNTGLHCEAGGALPCNLSHADHHGSCATPTARREGNATHEQHCAQ